MKLLCAFRYLFSNTKQLVQFRISICKHMTASFARHRHSCAIGVFGLFEHSSCKVNDISIHINCERIACVLVYSDTHTFLRFRYNTFIFPYSICDRIVFSKYYVPIVFLYSSTHNVPSELFDS